jgi:hypothetical protein
MPGIQIGDFVVIYFPEYDDAMVDGACVFSKQQFALTERFPVVSLGSVAEDLQLVYRLSSGSVSYTELDAIVRGLI